MRYERRPSGLIVPRRGIVLPPRGFLPGVGTSVGGLAGSSLSFSFVTSANGSDTSIELPSHNAGDLLMIFNYGNGFDGGGENFVANGWTVLADDNDGGIFCRGLIAAKKSSGSETNPTGVNAGVFERWICAVFRPSVQFSSFANGMTVNTETTSANPASQTITASGAGTPIILFGQMASSGAVSPRTNSPAMSEISGAATTHYAHYTIYNPGSTPADNSYDMDDEGNQNTLQSGYLTFSL